MTDTSMKKSYSVAILEDDDDMRGYLATIIYQTEGLTVALAAATVRAAIAATADLDTIANIDLCLVDLQLPDGSGLEFVKHIKQNSDAKILILTVLGDRTSVLLSLQAGANGYLLKDTPPNQIRRDITATLNGETPISPQAATHVLQLLQSQPKTLLGESAAEPSEEVLTKRETDIMNMFARGLSYKETAATLEISHHTVSDHVKSIYRKLSVHSRNEAIFEATQLGLIT